MQERFAFEIADETEHSIGFFGKVARQADRYAHILKYHHPSQLARRLAKRVWAPIESRLPSLPFKAAPPPVRRRDPSKNRFLEIIRIAVATSTDEQAAKNNIKNITAGKLTLLNREGSIGWPVDWELKSWPDAPPLWIFHLQYHEYLLDVIRHDLRVPTLTSVWELITSWIDHYGKSTRSRAKWAYHPYCISRRIPAWCWLYLAAPPANETLKKFIASLADQVHYLAAHLETDIGGNHLWENARALIIAGCFFEGETADYWRTLGIRILRQCVTEQLSPKGEHFERSPMYQADLARGLRELVHWLGAVDGCEAKYFATIADRMTSFLDAIRHPDGEIPLFGDSVIDHTRASSSILQIVRRPKQSAWAGDYFLHEQDEHKLIFDAGNIGPDHLPAHAHSDLLGFELSLFGQRVLVDSGTYCYSGTKRSEFRESRAHNVLTVDGVELADVWSSFRMGRRGHITGRWSGKTPIGHWVAAAHDAYKNIGINRILRLWFFADSARGPWISIHVAQGTSRERHDFCEYLHFHPNAVASYDESTDTLAGQTRPMEARPKRRWTCEKANRQIEIERVEGVYSPAFYQEEAAPLYILQQSSRLPALSCWAIHFANSLIRPQVALQKDVLTIVWKLGKKQHHTRIRLPT